jgi:hypothetical protein
MLHPRGFRDQAILPYGLRVGEVKAALDDIYDFLSQVNQFLVNKGWDRLEETLSSAAFSGMLSDLIEEGISKRSETVAKNKRHNGRPDLLPRGLYEGNAVHRGDEGIEVKASRYSTGWQGHNIEAGWIMICQFVIDLETEPMEQRQPTRFDRVLCAKLAEDDWSFSGRSATSRRTPTASIKASGKSKLEANPVYLDPAYRPRPLPRSRRLEVIAEPEPE